MFTLERERERNPGAYLKGCNAAFEGQILDDCPYIHGGWERSEWRAGFDEAIHGMPEQTGRQRTSCSGSSNCDGSSCGDDSPHIPDRNRT
jgi:hypothetical protein